jgi:8-oxo-dGTP pyrophosphatase MutT (NUDIX family)
VRTFDSAADDVMFEDLFSNSTYTIRVLGSFDLRNGEGVSEDILLDQHVFTTQIQYLPEPKIINLEVTNERINFDVDLNDPDVKAQDGTVNLREQEEEPKYKNALAIIFNVDNEILILKRSQYEEQWMPNKFGLVGGGVEEGETPEEAMRREVIEETGLQLDKVLDKGCIQRNPDSKEYLFLTLYTGNNDDVKLNKEHTDYVWSNFHSLKHHDCVPNLEEYVKLAVEKYD